MNNTIEEIKKLYEFKLEKIIDYDNTETSDKLNITNNNKIDYYIFEKVQKTQVEKNEYYIVIITDIEYYRPLNQIDWLSYKIMYKITVNYNLDSKEKYTFENKMNDDNKIWLKDDPFQDKYENFNNLAIYHFLEIPTTINLPKTVEELKKMGVTIGCGANCTVMGGKKSKRKLARKSMRKSKKVKKTKKVKIIKSYKNK